jgi:protein-L-isoaspartate(D-aspartate) O-methyltransferase
MISVEIRQRYAKKILNNAGIISAPLLKAFATVRREEYVGSGPWRVLSRVPGQIQPQVRETANPAELYHDVAVLLDPSRSLANGNPGTLAP